MCPHEQKLTAWLLGDLPPAERDALAEHLDGCAACRAARDELASVLAPLRSGLAKDAAAHLSAARAGSGAAPHTLTAPASSRRALAEWLWRRPHDGLKRAALLAVSFGTLFALVSAVYRSSLRERTAASDITHIEFHKAADAAPAEALAPLSDPTPASAPLEAELSRRHAIAPEREPVTAPALPAAAPSMPALKSLVRTEAAAPAAAPAPTPAPKPAPPAASKRERAKHDAVAKTRPPADVKARPVALAGASPAPAHAPVTNRAPTNAVAPASVKSKP